MAKVLGLGRIEGVFITAKARTTLHGRVGAGASVMRPVEILTRSGRVEARITDKIRAPPFELPKSEAVSHFVAILLVFTNTVPNTFGQSQNLLRRKPAEASR